MRFAFIFLTKNCFLRHIKRFPKITSFCKSNRLLVHLLGIFAYSVDHMFSCEKVHTYRYQIKYEDLTVQSFRFRQIYFHRVLEHTKNIHKNVSLSANILLMESLKPRSRDWCYFVILKSYNVFSNSM